MIHTPLPTLHREIAAYLSFIDEARKEIDLVEFPTYEACMARADAIKGRNPVTPGPGRYEGNDDLELAQMLDVLSHDQSFLDDEAGEVSTGWIGRVGRFCVSEDDYGFFTYQDFGTMMAASVAFAQVKGSYEVAAAE